MFLNWLLIKPADKGLAGLGKQDPSGEKDQVGGSAVAASYPGVN